MIIFVGMLAIHFYCLAKFPVFSSTDLSYTRKNRLYFKTGQKNVMIKYEYLSKAGVIELSILD